MLRANSAANLSRVVRLQKENNDDKGLCFDDFGYRFVCFGVLAFRLWVLRTTR